MDVLLNIDSDQKTPKYKQIVNAIVTQIAEGTLKRGQRISSINELSEEYYLSRDTVEKAYNELRSRGIITSVRGKGYYISRTDLNTRLKVLLVFNKISAYKKLIYNSFVQSLGDSATVDLHIHHFNSRLLESIITNNLGEYDYYVIMPHFYERLEEAIQVIKKIPLDKLILIDKDLKLTGSHYAAVYQDFELDIHQALFSGIDLLQKYDKLNLVYPVSVPYPAEIKAGFINFCRQASFHYQILNEIDKKVAVQPGEVYIVIEETDLVNLIKECRAKLLVPGKDIGIISFNETPLKEILADGITVISTDHEKMGEAAAQLILERRKEKIKAPFIMIRRNSL
jgi:DNA-binding transcriptional regulator YhcF (GntR family)